MSRSKKYHVIAAFTAASATARDRSWSDTFGRTPSLNHGDATKVLKKLPPTDLSSILENATAEPVDLVAIERLFAHRYSPDQQLKVESVLPSGMTHPPFFVDAHPIKKVPLQLIVHEAEFDTTTDALAWLETAPGKVFKMHADYVTVLFTGA